MTSSKNSTPLSEALVIVSIGTVDDVYRISAYQKLVFQIIAAAVALEFGVRSPIREEPLCPRQGAFSS